MNASACVVCPGGFGTLDELAEILTLVQTGKTRRIPIILAGTVFWSGLVDWFRDTLVTAGTIPAEDLEIFQILNDPKEVVDAIFDYYEHKSFEPYEREQEKLLELQEYTYAKTIIYRAACSITPADCRATDLD